MNKLELAIVFPSVYDDLYQQEDLMAKASYEDWIQAVKDRCKSLREDFEYFACVYSFRDAYEDDMKPNEAVRDCIEWLEA